MNDANAIQMLLTIPKATNLKRRTDEPSASDRRVGPVSDLLYRNISEDIIHKEMNWRCKISSKAYHY